MRKGQQGDGIVVVGTGGVDVSQPGVDVTRSEGL